MKILWTICKLLFIAAAVLFAVYFWNLDQKLLDLIYTRTQRVRDRERADVKF